MEGFYVPDDRFGPDVTGCSVNPITGGNWQGIGVQPQMRVAADKALETALNLIRCEKLKKN
jgi:hypothetical protein